MSSLISSGPQTGLLSTATHSINQVSRILQLVDSAKVNVVGDGYLSTCIALGSSALGLILVVLSLLDLRLTALQLEDRRLLETNDSLERLKTARRWLLQLLLPSVLSCLAGLLCFVFREWQLGVIAGLSTIALLLVIGKLCLALLQIKIELTQP